ncbi:hypothetical protein IW261DRAFT_1413165 [Armillaria novae-zelandiae]|uniref:Uncharacterized protein n=1 Tax=Armillaria novae-zelandiae TaxID=153914 RepID=A0AA39PU96_9AGAR|nr:hypothetical protein IW261DRAFT_1413165 [Armillaria novae-zelandiae]
MIFNYPLDETVPISLLLCPILPFPSILVLFRLMPVHPQKLLNPGYSRQSAAFMRTCKTLLERAINFSFPKEMEEEYSNADELAARLKELIISLDGVRRAGFMTASCWAPTRLWDLMMMMTIIVSGTSPLTIAISQIAPGHDAGTQNFRTEKHLAEVSGEGEIFKHLESIAGAIVEEATVLLNSAVMQTKPRHTVSEGCNGQFISNEHYAIRMYNSLGAHC